MPRNNAVKAVTGLPQPLEITHQQRREEMEELADILASVFRRLPPEERAKYMSDSSVPLAA
jgi:hypothetical protein